MKVVQRKIKKSGKDRKRIGRGGSAYILDKRRITAVQEYEKRSRKRKVKRTVCGGCKYAQKDVVLGASVVTVIGTGKSVLKITRNFRIYRRADPGTDEKRQIQVHGKGLQIEYYLNDEMKITGKIHTLEYEM